jgi:outer membrane protein OmpA-like peptidoglycan-associated protein
VVNNYKNTTNGHTIRWHIKEEKSIIPPEKITELKHSVKPEKTANGIHVTLRFVNEQQQPLFVSGLVKGMFSKNITLNNQAEIDTIVPKKTTGVEVMVTAKGYMLTYEKFKIAKNKQDYEQVITLQPIVKNSNVKLPNILFQPASDRFLPGSYDALKILKAFMQDNPSVKIEIQGHVNGPDMPNTKAYKALSLARAKAVYQYLINEGIDALRLHYKGFGNTRMVYPDPKSERESSMNRRVEIKILER